MIDVTADRGNAERIMIMDFSFLLEEEPMSMYECSKRSGIPYSTLSDIIKGKTPIDRVSAKNLRALADALGYSMDALYSMMHVPERTDFELFKSATCHKVKEMGDAGFIIDLLQSKKIRIMSNWGWFPESLYLLAMLDYLSRVNNIDLCSDYDDLRKTKLKEIIFPASVLALAMVTGSENAKAEALKQAIPEFLKYNIVESEIRNVI